MKMGILAGVAMLLTVVAPWGRGPERFTMSWDVIHQGSAGLGAWMIGCWVIGAASIVSALVLCRGALAMVQASLGFVAWVLALLGVTSLQGGPPEAGPPAVLILGLVGLLALTVLVAGTHLVLKMPGRGRVRLITGIAGAVLAALALVDLILIADAAGGAEPEVAAFVVFLNLAWVTLLAAGVVSAVNIRLLRGRTVALARAAFWLAVGGLAGMALVILLLPFVAKTPVFALTCFNALILVHGALSLVGRGGLTLGMLWLSRERAPLRRAPAPSQPPPAVAPQPEFSPAPPPAPPTGDLTGQLERLKDLFDQRLITQEEYDQKRKQALEKIG